MCYIIRVIVAAPDTRCLRQQEGVPARKPFASEREYQRDLRSLCRCSYRRGRALACRHHARADAPTSRAHGGHRHPARPGLGKPAQPRTGEDGDIRVTLRTITEGKP